MSSLGERIALLANPTPEVADPEDTANTESNKNICLSQKEDEWIDLEEEVSDLRRKTAPLLEDVDKNYAGRKVKRKNLASIYQEDDEVYNEDEVGNEDEISDEDDSEEPSGSDEDEDESDEDEGDEDEEGDEFSDSEISEFKKFMARQSKENGVKNKEDEEEEYSTEDEELEGAGEDGKAKAQKRKEDKVTQQFSNIDINSEVQKGQAIHNQLEIWNRLLETRIKLQKLLIMANKLPQAPMWSDLLEKGGKEGNEYLNLGVQSLNKLLECWTYMQSILIDKNSELRSTNTDSATSVKKVNESDEEIPSDTDEEQEKPSSVVSNGLNQKKKRKATDEDYDVILTKRFKDLVPYRNSVIQKWDDKTRLATGKLTQKSFDAFDNSALKRIDQLLQDRTRLIRRTQLKRSLYRVLGKPEIKTEFEKPDDNEKQEQVLKKQDLTIKDYDPEVFDDDDFYRQVLKDVIENRSFSIDPAVVRKQLELQKQRSKTKKIVDTKASKGRKIRFHVLPKLVNLMAKVRVCDVPDEARNSFLKHIFGGKDEKN